MIRRLIRLFSCVPPTDAVRFIFWTALRRRRACRMRIGGVSLRLRTRTSDYRVARSILVEGEFADVDLTGVRVVVDGGANIGVSAIDFARRLPEATIIAVEPEAENFAALVENVCSWPNVRPIRAALTAASGVRNLLDQGTGPWGYTVTNLDRSARDAGQTVECLSIPDLMQRFDLDRIDLLKLDIEGGEKEILESCDDWIDRVSVIVAELHENSVPGCETAFANAVRGFAAVTPLGEKVAASRFPEPSNSTTDGGPKIAACAEGSMPQ